LINKEARFMTKILVTGATGTVGSQLIPLLEANGLHPTALVRDRSRARSILGHRVALAEGDFAEPASIRAALDGVDTVFLCCGNVSGQVDYECTLIDESRRVGVRRIVKLSARGAECGSSVGYWDWHAQIEQHLLSSGIRSVLVQPSFYMSNLFAAAESVRSQGMLFAPAATAAISMINPADVAAVAARLLIDGSHDGSAYVITGPEAIGYGDIADQLSAATGQQVGFVDVPPAAARTALIEVGMPPFAADQILAAFAALRGGAQATTTDTVRSITGSKPRAFAEFAREHAGVFGADRRLTA
jgi:uncharacterized protein YbjT (DUF2867 family)